LYKYLLIQFTKYNYVIPPNTKGITKEILLMFLSSRQSSQKGALGYISSGGWSTFIKKTFPDKPKNTNYYDWLLAKDGMKFCPRCNRVLSLSVFWKNANTKSKYNSYCTSCMKPLNAAAHRSIQARYRSKKLKSTPV